MNKKRTDYILYLLLACLLSVGMFVILMGCTVNKTHHRPNILFIFSDDHAYQAISAYGGRLAEVAPTPNIDRIASEGILFTRCYVTNSICAPSRATILTGKHSHLNGIRTNADAFDGKQSTFPKLLRQSGYQTALIGKQRWPIGEDSDLFPGKPIIPAD